MYLELTIINFKTMQSNISLPCICWYRYYFAYSGNVHSVAWVQFKSSQFRHL